MKCQPLYSSHINVLDIKFLNCIQSIQHQTALRKIDELIVAVIKSVTGMMREISDKFFFVLQLALKTK